MNNFLSVCANCGLETEIARFTDGSFLCDECSKLENNKAKNKIKDSKPNKRKFFLILWLSLHFLTLFLFRLK